eukprot:927346_1
MLLYSTLDFHYYYYINNSFITMSCLEEQRRVIKIMNAVGYTAHDKIADTLQGTVWRAVQRSTNKLVVIKATDRYLHQNHICTRVVNGRRVEVQVHENCKKELRILKYLSRDTRCPASIVKYIHSFQSTDYYFIVMEDGGRNLFDFITKAHRFLEHGSLKIGAWHDACKVIFKQMMECVEYIHCKNVSHFDISLENFLINEVEIIVNPDGTIRFCAESIQIKLCDFGLAELFDSNKEFSSSKYCGKTKYSSPEVTSEKDTFCAQSNDIWCLGVCLFMMIIGSAPWHKASIDDDRFVTIVNGGIVGLLSRWKKLHYTDPHIIRLFTSLFKLEEKRVAMDALKGCEWMH